MPKQSERILLRNSERSSFKTCRFRWAVNFGGVWQDIGPLRSKEPAKALWFGDLVHQSLALHYPPGTKRGPKPAATFVKLYDKEERLSAVLRDDEGEWQSMRDLGEGMLKAFVEEYEARDSEWEVISSEQTFRLPLVVPASDLMPEFRITVVGTFDGVWRNRSNRKRIVFKEWKTAAQISLDGLPMDDQAGYYWTYGPKWLRRQEILGPKEEPTEILYTFLRKAIRNPEWTYDSEGHKLNNPTKDDLLAAFPKIAKPLMTLAEMIERIGVEKSLLAGQPSKSQPAAFFERQPVYRDRPDRENVHARVLSEAREMALLRLGMLDAYKNPGPLHNPNCRGCPVREACELHETGSDWRAMLNATTESWNPYAAHEMIERR